MPPACATRAAGGWKALDIAVVSEYAEGGVLAPYKLNGRVDYALEEDVKLKPASDGDGGPVEGKKLLDALLRDRPFVAALLHVRPKDRVKGAHNFCLFAL